jgi:hypothetical protein
VDVRPPKHLAARRLDPVPICAIRLQEIDVPAGQEPISWLLLTSLAVDTIEQDDRCVLWYTYRWAIERFHFTLKSGGNYEKLQLETADCLWRALAIYMIVAWRLLYVDLVARTHPHAPGRALHNLPPRRQVEGPLVSPPQGPRRAADTARRTYCRSLAGHAR